MGEGSLREGLRNAGFASTARTGAWRRRYAHVVFEGPGPLVRAWRLQYGRCCGRTVTQSDVANALGDGVKDGTFKAFEEGRRPLSRVTTQSFLEVVAKLDAYFEAGHVLYDLVAALDTPKAFTEPRSEWRHNYSLDAVDARPVFKPARRVNGVLELDGQAEPAWRVRDPVWAWIRPAEALGGGELTKVRGQVTWGPLTLRIEAECGPNGVFVTCPTSSPHPAARVQLDEPGWVDFGRGQLPPAWMGGSDQSGLNAWSAWTGCSVVRPTAALLAVGKICAMVAVVGNELGRRGGGREALAQHLKSLVAGAAHLVNVVAAATGREDPDVIDATGDPLPEGATHADRVDARFGKRQKDFRDARHISQAEAAKVAQELLSAHHLLGDRKVTKDMIQAYEEGTSVPRNRLLLAALDRLYGADGSTCFVEVTATRFESRGTSASDLQLWQVAFPSFWVGPVCLVAHSPSADSGDTGRLGLRWDAWANDLLVRHGKAISTRQDEPGGPPLQVLLEPGWQLLAFVGEHPAAFDVSSIGWYAAPGRERDLYRHYLDNYLSLAATITEQDRSTFDQAFIREFGDEEDGSAAGPSSSHAPALPQADV